MVVGAATDGDEADWLLLECAAAAEETDDESDGADDDQRDGSGRDDWIGATDLHDVLVTDDGRLDHHRDAATQQCHPA